MMISKKLTEALSLDKPWKWLETFLANERFLPRLEGVELEDVGLESMAGIEFEDGWNGGTALESLFAKSIFSDGLVLTSAGRTCRMLQCGDGYLALNLARESDFELLPAWLQDGSFSSVKNAETISVASKNAVWEAVSLAVRDRSVWELNERAGELGLAAAVAKQENGLTKKDIFVGENTLLIGKNILPDKSVLPELAGENMPECNLADPTNKSEKSEITRDIRVVDISALWAGPLAGKLFAAAGAEVIKLESISRPDGLRAGMPKFFEYLNAQKVHKQIDFRTSEGKAELKSYLESTDVVIDNSRPRALPQLGIEPEEFVKRGIIWISITGYGRGSNRVAFGDDAAVAGGLFFRDKNNAPHFIGDAIADPITGVNAYIDAMDCLEKNKADLLDVNMVSTIKALINKSKGFG